MGCERGNLLGITARSRLSSQCVVCTHSTGLKATKAHWQSILQRAWQLKLEAAGKIELYGLTPPTPAMSCHDYTVYVWVWGNVSSMGLGG